MPPAEEKLLRTLASRGPLTRAAARASTATVQKLLHEGLVSEISPSRKGTSPKLALTPAGQAIADKSPPQKVSLSDVYRELRALQAEIRELKELIRQSPDVSDSSSHSFENRLKSAAKDLDQRFRLGGLVPIPSLRHALADLAMSTAAFDDALLALEDQYLIDLKVANDPDRLPNASLGIHTADRGLLYFLVLR